MTQDLNDLLRQGADAVAVPRLDLRDLVAEVERRRRRRLLTVVAASAVAAGAVAVASVLATGALSRTASPLPGDPVAPSSGTVVEDAASRPLVYADGRTVHVGDRTTRADEPVAFVAPTDDGAVFEAMLDGRLWFTDGTRTEMIGTSGFTAAPTSHAGVVSTGPSGSLVVWADRSRSEEKEPTELVVYDTSRHAEVARIPVPDRDAQTIVAYVGDDEVWYADRATSRHVHRFDLRSGTTRRLDRSDLDAVLDRQSRVFTAVAPDGRVVHGPPSFSVQAGRLVARIDAGVVAAAPVTLADGSRLRLRLPTGYVGPWPADEAPALTVSQWLDDDHVVLWADDGGGDLPAKSGDLLVCRLPDGACTVTVPRTPRRYVAPYLDGPTG